MDTSKTSSDEIDLEELALGFIIGVKRNFLLITILFVVGTGAGIAYGLMATKVYESKMMVTSDILTESYVDKLGKNLNDIIREDNLQLLGEKLNLTPEESEKVLSIELEGVQKEKPQVENEKLLFYILITVQVTDQTFLPALQKGILGYLENLDFVKVRVAQRKTYNEELIRQIDLELKSLQDFQQAAYSGKYDGSKEGGFINVTDISSKIIILTEEKLKYQSILQFANSVQVVEDFTILRRPRKPNVMACILAGAFLGLFSSFVIIIYGSLSKKVKLAEATQNQ